MKLSNDRGHRPQVDTFSYQKISSFGNELYLTDLFAQRVPWKPKNSIFAKTIGFFLHSEGKALLLKKTSIQDTEHREIKPVSTYWVVFLILEGIPHTIKGEK